MTIQTPTAIQKLRLAPRRSQAALLRSGRKANEGRSNRAELDPKARGSRANRAWGWFPKLRRLGGLPRQPNSGAPFHAARKYGPQRRDRRPHEPPIRVNLGRGLYFRRP